MSSDDQDMESFEAMFEQSEMDSPQDGQRGVDVGDVVTGTVISVTRDEVFVALGGKSEGVLAIDQVTDEEGDVTVVAGDTVEARVVDIGQNTGVVELRRTLGRGANVPSELEIAAQHEIPVEGVVQGVNQGGFEVLIGKVAAFCPISQIDARFVENPETFIGQRLTFRITRYETGRGGNPNVVLSRRVLLEEENAQVAAVTRSKLEVGSIFTGKVTSIADYGAFVDIGGMDGMLHISQLGFSRVEHPSEMLEVGQVLDVQVIGVEATDNPRRPEKISLSLKSLAKDPWADVPTKYPVGSNVTGKVGRIEQFGAFVELEPGIEGLVHISQMGGGEHVSSARKVVSADEVVRATVMSIDVERRRIGLSMDAAGKAADAAIEREAIEKYSPSDQGFGTFADLLKGAKD